MNLRDKHGFTLIEVMVVIVILSVLMALAVPSVLKYVNEGDNAQALDDAYACVSAANYYGIRAYMRGIEMKDVSSEKLVAGISKKSATSGKIIDYVYDEETYKITGFLYQSPKNIYVKYDGEKYEIVDPNAYLNPNTAAKVLASCLKISEGKNFTSINNVVGSEGRTQKLQKAYLEAFDGNYVLLSENEKNTLKKLKYDGDLELLRWKPSYMANGDIYLMADIKTGTSNKGSLGASQGPLIYYNGQYYYHRHSASYGQNRATSVWIAEGALVLDSEWILTVVE